MPAPPGAAPARVTWTASPGFSYFQARAGQPIDRAIAEVLLAGRAP